MSQAAGPIRRSLDPVTTTAEMRARFHSGALLDQWAAAYPQLFDAHEVRTARNQLGGHFYEWLCAVRLYERTGWLSLIESYQFKVQTWKRGILRALGAEDVLAFFDGQRERGFGRLQAPDLLVYAPDFSDYVFCEVKGPTDRLRPEQAAYFAAMAEACGKEVFALDVVIAE